MFRDVEEILRRQSGVISRRQALSMGMQQHDIRRMMRRNEWARVHHGVYVDHTGTLTWLQGAWAAVLYASPAALCLGSALRVADAPGRSMRNEADPIHVAIARKRAMLTEPAGVRIHHVARFDERVLWNVGPPRLRYEDAALDVACAATSELDAIAVLADCCQSRRTTARRLLHTLDSRLRVRRRRWLQDVLADIADGTCSVIEHGYLDRVERPHGLPRAVRQKRNASSVGICYRDAEYGGRLIVELDGRMFHDSATRRDADFERDLDAAAVGRSTVRLSYGQVFGRPCRTAAKIAQVMRLHGIDMNAHSCGRTGCQLAGFGRAA